MAGDLEEQKQQLMSSAAAAPMTSSSSSKEEIYTQLQAQERLLENELQEALDENFQKRLQERYEAAALGALQNVHATPLQAFAFLLPTNIEASSCRRSPQKANHFVGSSARIWNAYAPQVRSRFVSPLFTVQICQALRLWTGKSNSKNSIGQ